MIDGFSLIGAKDSIQYGTAESVRQERIGGNGQFFFQFGNLFLKNRKLPFFSMPCKLVIVAKPETGSGYFDCCHSRWLT